MQPWLLDLLTCPSCKTKRLEVKRRDLLYALPDTSNEDLIIAEGVLRCKGCERLYPVLDEAPRLVCSDELTVHEKQLLERSATKPPLVKSAPQLSDSQLDEFLEKHVLDNYGNPSRGPSLRRAQRDAEYQLAYANNRVYQMEVLRRLVPRPPRLVLDIGGGSGGNIRAIQNVFSVERAIVLDLDPGWAPAYQRGDRRVAYVRGDATRAPFAPQTFDLVICSFLLEHVQEWKDLVLSIHRIGQSAFVAFGPNRLFPFELGHINAPLVQLLPPALGAPTAYAWGVLTGNRRTYRRIVSILREMNYVFSSTYYEFCQRSHISCLNLFPQIMEAWALRRGFGGLPPALIQRVVFEGARVLSAFGLEPNVYSFYLSDAERTTPGDREP